MWLYISELLPQVKNGFPFLLSIHFVVTASPFDVLSLGLPSNGGPVTGILKSDGHIICQFKSEPILQIRLQADVLGSAHLEPVKILPPVFWMLQNPVRPTRTFLDLRNVLMQRIVLSTFQFRINTRYKVRLCEKFLYSPAR